MLRASFKDSSPATQLVLSGFLVVICFLLMLFVTSIGAYLFFDVNIFTQPEALNNQGENINIPLLKYFQMMYSIGLFVVPSFVIAYLLHNRIAEYLSLNKWAPPKKFFMAIVITFSAIPLINLMAEFNSHLSLPGFLSGLEEWMRNSEENIRVATERFLAMPSFNDLLINILMIGLISGVGEELLFRGVIQQIITKWTKSHHAGIILAAFAFSALHLQFFGFLPRMAMGVLFGYLLVWTGSLWIPILAHVINNSIIVTGHYLMSKGNLPENMDQVGTSGMGWQASIVSILLTGFLIVLFYRTRKR